MTLDRVTPALQTERDFHVQNQTLRSRQKSIFVIRPLEFLVKGGFQGTIYNKRLWMSQLVTFLFNRTLPSDQLYQEAIDESTLDWSPFCLTGHFQVTNYTKRQLMSQR